MRQHALRKLLTPKDYDRIQAAIEVDDVEAVTLEELDAVSDMMFDFHSNRVRTHYIKRMAIQ